MFAWKEQVRRREANRQILFAAWADRHGNELMLTYPDGFDYFRLADDSQLPIISVQSQDGYHDFISIAYLYQLRLFLLVCCRDYPHFTLRGYSTEQQRLVDVHFPGINDDSRLPVTSDDAPIVTGVCVHPLKGCELPSSTMTRVFVTLIKPDGQQSIYIYDSRFQWIGQLDDLSPSPNTLLPVFTVSGRWMAYAVECADVMAVHGNGNGDESQRKLKENTSVLKDQIKSIGGYALNEAWKLAERGVGAIGELIRPGGEFNDTARENAGNARTDDSAMFFVAQLMAPRQSKSRVPSTTLGVVSVVDLGSLTAEKRSPTALLRFRPHHHAVHQLAFHSNGSWMASTSAEGTTIYVWQLMSPLYPSGPQYSPLLVQHPACQSTIHCLFKLHRGYTSGEVDDLQWSADGSWLAATTRSGTAHIWRLQRPEATSNSLIDCYPPVSSSVAQPTVRLFDEIAHRQSAVSIFAIAAPLPGKVVPAEPSPSFGAASSSVSADGERLTPISLNPQSPVKETTPPTAPRNNGFQQLQPRQPIAIYRRFASLKLAFTGDSSGVRLFNALAKNPNYQNIPVNIIQSLGRHEYSAGCGFNGADPTLFSTYNSLQIMLSTAGKLTSAQIVPVVTGNAEQLSLVQSIFGSLFGQTVDRRGPRHSSSSAANTLNSDSTVPTYKIIDRQEQIVGRNTSTDWAALASFISEHPNSPIPAELLASPNLTEKPVAKLLPVSPGEMAMEGGVKQPTAQPEWIGQIEWQTHARIDAHPLLLDGRPLVELLTEMKRPLWSGPQFQFKMYSAPSQSPEMADYSASDLINATAVDFAAVLDWVDSSLSEPLLQPGRDSSDQQIQQALDEENFSTMHSISQSNYTQ